MTVKQFWQRLAPHALFGAFQFIIMLSIVQPIHADERPLTMAYFLTATVAALCAVFAPPDPSRRFWCAMIALCGAIECWFLLSTGWGKDDALLTAVQAFIFASWSLSMYAYTMFSVRRGVISLTSGVAQMLVAFGSSATIVVYAGLITEKLIPTSGFAGAIFPLGLLSLVLIVPGIMLVFSEVFERRAA